MEEQKNTKIYSTLLGAGFALLVLAGVVMFIGILYQKLAIFLMISIAIIILALLFIFLGFRKGEKQETDYYTLFIIGITWLAVGIPLKNYALFIMGLVFMGVGLANKDKWKKQEKWSEIPKGKKRLKIFLMIGLLFFLLLGVVVLYFTKEVSGF